MEVKKYEDINVAEFVQQILARKQQAINNAVKNMQKNRADIWDNGNCQTSKLWASMDIAYDWLQEHDTNSTQTYRRLADEISPDGYECRHQETWILITKWLRTNGNPRDNKRWVNWQCAWRDMERY